MTHILPLDPTTKKNVDQWLQGDFDEATKDAIKKRLKENPQEIIDAFYTHLSFGTGGMRGIMGIGTNRMNVYTVRLATQGLANYLQSRSERECAVLIGYDSRHQSHLFAEEAAKVLAGNGIHVYLFSSLRPVPLVSFGCRYKKCAAAIMITASHNPANYNGYKVYGNDGGQVVPPDDAAIVSEVNKITDMGMVKSIATLSHPLIESVDQEIDRAYLKATANYPFYPKENAQEGHLLHIVYTSLHGTGITMVPKTLEQWGFTHVDFVKEQITPDGDFPTVKYPNPEDHAALALGIETMKQCHGDLLIATDPDADRMGVVANDNGSPQFFSGNEIACLCLYHICEALSSQERMPEKGAFIKSIATTELFQVIAKSFKIPCFEVEVGFKYFAEKIRQWEHNHNHFIFGAEESYGYLLGTHSRDKDAVISSALICEVALQCKRQGKTLKNLLHDIYRKFGVYIDQLFSVTFQESKEGRDQMARGMEAFEKKPPEQFLGIDVAVMENFQKSIKIDLKTGETTPLILPQSNVLRFWLTDGTKLMIRPSGTEPKIKIYCGVVDKKPTDIFQSLKTCEERASRYIQSINAMFAKM